MTGKEKIEAADKKLNIRDVSEYRDPSDTIIFVVVKPCIDLLKVTTKILQHILEILWGLFTLWNS